MTRLARASALQFTVQAVQTIIGGLATLYFTNVLGFGVFGQYALTLAVVNVVLIPNFGILTATQKRISEGSDRGRYYGGGIALQLALMTVMVVVLFLVRGPLDAFLGYQAAVLVATFVVLKGQGLLLLNTVRGEQRVELAAIIEGGWNIVIALVQVGFVFAGAGLVGLVGGEIAAAFGAVVVGLLVVDIRPRLPDWRTFIHLYNYGKFSWLQAVKAMSYSWMDTLVLGFFVMPAIVGVYEVAWRVSALFILLPTAVGKVVFPGLSNRAVEGRTDEIERILERALTFAAFLAIPGLVGAIVLGDGVLRLFGESVDQLQTAMLVLVVLGIARVIESFEVLLLQALNALDYPNRAFRIGLFFAALNVTLNVGLVHTVGAVGAAVATTVSMVASAGLALRAFPTQVSISVSPKPIIAQLAGAALMGIALVGLRLYQPPSTHLLTLAYVSIGAIVYGLSVVTVSAETRSRISQVIDETLA